MPAELARKQPKRALAAIFEAIGFLGRYRALCEAHPNAKAGFASLAAEKRIMAGLDRPFRYQAREHFFAYREVTPAGIDLGLHVRLEHAIVELILVFAAPGARPIHAGGPLAMFARRLHEQAAPKAPVFRPLTPRFTTEAEAREVLGEALALYDDLRAATP